MKKTYMFCTHKLKDFNRWKKMFDSHTPKHEAAGLTLVRLWREVGKPNNVFFIMEVADIEKANAFVNAPGNEGIAEQAGLLEGTMHYVEEIENA